MSDNNLINEIPMQNQIKTEKITADSCDFGVVDYFKG